MEKKRFKQGVHLKSKHENEMIWLDNVVMFVVNDFRLALCSSTRLISVNMAKYTIVMLRHGESEWNKVRAIFFYSLLIAFI